MVMVFIRLYRIIVAILLAASLVLRPETGRTLERTAKLTPDPDIKYRQISSSAPSGSVTVHMVLVDLDAVRSGRLTVEPAPAGSLAGQVASPGSIGRRLGALATINGPYFAAAGGKTYPLGFTAIGGRLVQLGNLRRPIVGIDPDGEFRIEVAHPQAFITSEAYFEPVWLWGVNIPAGADAVTMYDGSWGERVSCQGGVAVAIAPQEGEGESDVVVVGPLRDRDESWDGEVVAVSDSGSVEIPSDGCALVFRGRQAGASGRYREGARAAVYVYELPEGWETMGWIATLGPWFVREGRVRDFSEETAYGQTVTGRAARSAIGITWNDEIFFAITRGASLSVLEAADVLIECNAREAVMCDSGSSSGMWVAGVGALGNSREIPLAFAVRERDEDEETAEPLRVWSGRLFRH